MGRVLRGRSVGRDLDRIFTDVSRNNGESSAIVQLNRIEKAFEHLGAFPHLGPSRSELAPGLRAWSLKPWEILYRAMGEDVEIIRVLDGRMNIAALFGKKT